MKQLMIRKMENLDYAGTESLNTICSNLSFAGKNLKKIIVTSCTEHEGKSYLTLQIMQNLARRGKRVVLVDMDLRRSMLISRYNMESEGEMMGIAHYLAGYCGIEDALYETNIYNGYIMPEGRDVSNPIPLINSQDFVDLLNYLSENFDVVLIDAPPVGLVIDAAEIARLCDGAVFVCEYNRTRRRELNAAKHQIEQAGCRVLGAIINKVAFDTLSSKKYYNRSYYSRYSSNYYRRDDGSKGGHSSHHHSGSGSSSSSHSGKSGK